MKICHSLPVLLTMFLLHTPPAFAQRERVFTSLDKYTCQPGDKLWFKSVVFQGGYPSYVSTKLYCQVYRPDGRVVSEGVFPVSRGITSGGLVLQDTLSTGTYYLVAYTLQQLEGDSSGVFSLPLVMFNRDRPGRAAHLAESAPGAVFAAGTAGKVRWVSAVVKDSLMVQVMVDSLKDSLGLRVACVRAKDSVTRADLKFTRSDQVAFLSFGLTPGRYKQELYLEEDSVILSRQVIPVGAGRDSIRLRLDTLDVSPYGVNDWTLEFPDSALYFASVAVSDADRSISPPVTIEALNGPYSDDYTFRPSAVDSSYLTFTGRATRELGKPIREAATKSLVMMGIRDSTLFMETVKMGDDGSFRLDSVCVFGAFNLGYQVNCPVPDAKDVKLLLAPSAAPRLPVTFMDRWLEEKPLVKADTFQYTEEIRETERRHMASLAPVTVKAWKDPSRDLDRDYPTGAFSEASGMFFDLRTYSSPYNRDFTSFLLANVLRIKYDYILDSFIDIAGHKPVVFYLNQEECDINRLKGVPFEQLAYIKILESGPLNNKHPDAKLVPINGEPPPTKTMLPPMYPDPGEPKGGPAGATLKLPVWKTPLNVCVWTRKGKDFRTMPGGMASVAVDGFTPSVPFSQDRATLYWDPYAVGHHVRVHFVNNEHARRFRIVVEGMNYRGQVVHLERIVSNASVVAFD